MRSGYVTQNRIDILTESQGELRGGPGFGCAACSAFQGRGSCSPGFNLPERTYLWILGTHCICAAAQRTPAFEIQKNVQTASDLPHFVSSVVVTGMVLSSLHTDGLIHNICRQMAICTPM